MDGRAVTLGYDLKDKKLVINPQEAELVRTLFEKYLSCKSPQYLADWLNDQGYRTKSKITKNGKNIGGKPFERAHLYRIFDNKIYLGKVFYKGETYEGQHEAIISQELWDKVHKLKDMPVREKAPINKTFEFKTLKGLLFCGCCGYAMVPTRAQKRDREYHYYTSLKALKKSFRFCEVKSIPALVLENYIFEKIKSIMRDPLLIHAMSEAFKKDSLDIDEYKVVKTMVDSDFCDTISAETRQNLFNFFIEKITIWPNKINIRLKPKINKIVQKSLLENKIWFFNSELQTYEMTEEVSFLKRNQQTEIHVSGEAAERRQDKQLIVALVRAFGWQNKLDKGNLNIQELSELEQLERGYMGKIIKLTLLAPDIVESILAGLQPPNLTLISFLRSPIPVDWNEQRKKYGFSS